MISILILTLNEEVNLPACLASVSWADDVVVMDSLSTDRTVEVAKAAGARVIQRVFDNWASHQNWAMENIVFKHPWVFYLDADERMTEQLRLELEQVASDPKESRVAFYCGRRNYFLGRWIRHAMPPIGIMRFFQPPMVRFERLVNPTAVIGGQHGYLKNHFLHYNFSKGFADWFAKHNRYSDFEAIEAVRLLSLHQHRPHWREVFSKDPALRRKALRQLSFSLPGRSLLKFLYLYFIKRGFLDGCPGFTYCVLQSIYEYLIILKMKELNRREVGLPL